MLENPPHFDIEPKLYNRKSGLKPLLITNSSYSQQFFMENEFFKYDKLHEKIILGNVDKTSSFKQTYPEFENYTKSEISLRFQGIDKTDIKSVIEYAQNSMNSKFTLVESSFDSIADIYKVRDVYESNPIDTIFLAIYSGVGTKYEPGVINPTNYEFKELLKEYHPVNYSSIVIIKQEYEI